MTADQCFPFRIVSGFRPLRGLHLGHYEGVLKDLCRLQMASYDCSFVFIADHHARSKWSERADLANINRRTYGIARELVSVGIAPEFTSIYRQSDVPEIFEIMWFLAGMVSDGQMRHIATFATHASPTAGLYLYPLLMVADIISVKATNVAVGGDQKQHLELARDLARKLLRRIDPTIMPVPEALAGEPTILRGIEGGPSAARKMAFENDNDILIFGEKDQVVDRIDSIRTRPISWGEPLPTEDCAILEYARCLEGESARHAMAMNFSSGKYGYRDAKNDLKEMFFRTFGEARRRAAEISDQEVELLLRRGGERAREQIAALLAELRSHLALNV